MKRFCLLACLCFFSQFNVDAQILDDLPEDSVKPERNSDLIKSGREITRAQYASVRRRYIGGDAAEQARIRLGLITNLMNDRETSLYLLTRQRLRHDFHPDRSDYTIRDDLYSTIDSYRNLRDFVENGYYNLSPNQIPGVVKALSPFWDLVPPKGRAVLESLVEFGNEAVKGNPHQQALFREHITELYNGINFHMQAKAGELAELFLEDPDVGERALTLNPDLMSLDAAFQRQALEQAFPRLAGEAWFQQMLDTLTAEGPNVANYQALAQDMENRFVESLQTEVPRALSIALYQMETERQGRARNEAIENERNNYTWAKRETALLGVETFGQVSRFAGVLSQAMGNHDAGGALAGVGDMATEFARFGQGMLKLEKDLEETLDRLVDTFDVTRTVIGENGAIIESTEGLQEAVEIFSQYKLMTTLKMVNLTLNFYMAAFSIIGSFMGGDDGTAKMLQKILEEIQDLRQYVGKRFDKVDHSLKRLLIGQAEISKKLDHILSEVRRIQQIQELTLKELNIIQEQLESLQLKDTQEKIAIIEGWQLSLFSRSVPIELQLEVSAAIASVNNSLATLLDLQSPRHRASNYGEFLANPESESRLQGNFLQVARWYLLCEEAMIELNLDDSCGDLDAAKARILESNVFKQMRRYVERLALDFAAQSRSLALAILNERSEEWKRKGIPREKLEDRLENLERLLGVKRESSEKSHLTSFERAFLYPFLTEIDQIIESTEVGQSLTRTRTEEVRSRVEVLAGEMFYFRMDQIFGAWAGEEDAYLNSLSVNISKAYTPTQVLTRLEFLNRILPFIGVVTNRGFNAPNELVNGYQDAEGRSLRDRLASQAQITESPEIIPLLIRRIERDRQLAIWNLQDILSAELAKHPYLDGIELEAFRNLFASAGSEHGSPRYYLGEFMQVLDRFSDRKNYASEEDESYLSKLQGGWEENYSQEAFRENHREGPNPFDSSLWRDVKPKFDFGRLFRFTNYVPLVTKRALDDHGEIHDKRDPKIKDLGKGEFPSFSFAYPTDIFTENWWKKEPRARNLKGRLYVFNIDSEWFQAFTTKWSQTSSVNHISLAERKRFGFFFEVLPSPAEVVYPNREGIIAKKDPDQNLGQFAKSEKLSHASYQSEFENAKRLGDALADVIIDGDISRFGRLLTADANPASRYNHPDNLIAVVYQGSLPNDAMPYIAHPTQSQPSLSAVVLGNHFILENLNQAKAAESWMRNKLVEPNASEAFKELQTDSSKRKILDELLKTSSYRSYLAHWKILRTLLTNSSAFGSLWSSSMARADQKLTDSIRTSLNELDPSKLLDGIRYFDGQSGSPSGHYILRSGPTELFQVTDKSQRQFDDARKLLFRSFTELARTGSLHSISQLTEYYLLQYETWVFEQQVRQTYSPNEDLVIDEAQTSFIRTLEDAGAVNISKESKEEFRNVR